MESVTARLLANTRTRRRPDSLVGIARDIRWLEGHLRSLHAVSQLIGISVGMLNRFLSVESLAPETRRLVEEREIDHINTVYYMRGFDAEGQRVIAEEVMAGRLSGGDVRVLAPLHRSLPHLPVAELVSRVQSSKDKKVFVAYFHVPSDRGGADILRERFAGSVGEDNIVALSVEEELGTLKLTPQGLERLRQAARDRNMQLRRLVDALVAEAGHST